MRSFSSIVATNGEADGRYVEILETKLRELLRYVLVQVEVDEAWYRKVYADVNTAIQSGAVKTARHHFIQDGYFEDRFPRHIEVDERWYVQEYLDVARAIKQGVYKTGAQHFYHAGYKEGRLPSMRWSLLGENRMPEHSEPILRHVLVSK